MDALPVSPGGNVGTKTGLASQEAKQRLSKYGPNDTPDEHRRTWRVLVTKFWAPVPWMLEITIGLQLALGKRDEALIIAALLVFNAVLSLIQEERAGDALALLRRRLAIYARVLRDGHWGEVAARELVPGDVVHLRMGDISPADVRLTDGDLLVDQSSLTGESLPVEATQGSTAYAGAIIRRGEATGEVTATGSHTYFGRTAELMRTARTVSHLESMILTIVKYLVAIDAALVATLFVYAIVTGVALTEIVPFALILLVASVPVALPATFTLATAFGAVELATRGVLVTRLSAIEEAAAMDVLATDKTGTLTQNQLALADSTPWPPYTRKELLGLAALACDEATQDPIDLAILDAAKTQGLLTTVPHRKEFIPFDPATKSSEAVLEEDGRAWRVLKGAPRAVADRVSEATDLAAENERLSGFGYRVLAVAAGPEKGLHLVGLLALHDPPRPDSETAVRSLKELGVRVVMVTGDGLATARTVAAQVGIGDRACGADRLRTDDANVSQCDVFGGVLPEDKFRLVRLLQRSGHVTGMTGDGVNDAPALKQAEVGVAVANATDVTKAAASIVLTNPGLTDVVEAVRVSRQIYQRMLTYTLNKIIKTLEIAFFLSFGLMFTGTFVVTPLLIVLLLFTNDFVTMSIATDHVSFSQKPDRWSITTLVATAGPLAALILVLSFSVFFAGRDFLHLPLPQLQTLIFVLLVFSGQGTVYLVRERRHFWHSMPSSWLLISSMLDIAIVSILSIQGILMAPICPWLVGGLFIVVLLFLIAVEGLKVALFRRLGLH